MNNTAGSFLTISKFSPLQLLELIRPEILFQIKNEKEYSEEEAQSLFNSLKEIVNHLKIIRSSNPFTFNYLDDRIKQFHPKDKSYAITVLFRVTTPDSYFYAYNFLGPFVYRDLNIPFISKFFPEPEHLWRIKQEDEEENIETATNKPKIPENQTKIISFNGTETNGKTLIEIREYIKEKIESIDVNLHWKYVFFTIDDFKLFLDIMSGLYAGTKYSIPEIINLMPKCKGRFACVLHTIHKKYRYRTPDKIKDQDFFKIVRIFNLFKELNDSQIYGDISRTCDET
jgi:hypothetical protein